MNNINPNNFLVIQAPQVQRRVHILGRVQPRVLEAAAGIGVQRVAPPLNGRNIQIQPAQQAIPMEIEPVNNRDPNDMDLDP